MIATFKQRLQRQLLAAYDPLSSALVPLLHGLARRALRANGAVVGRRQLAGIAINRYLVPPHPGAQGPALLFVHGIADNALTWSLVIPSLRSLGPIWAIDLPGFGLSGYPAERHYATIAEHTAAVVALIREEIRRPVVLVGNSMGGWIGVRVAIQAPELLAGLVLINPGGAMLGGRPDWEEFLQSVAMESLVETRRTAQRMFGLPWLIYAGLRSLQAIFLRKPVVEFIAATDEREFFRADELAAVPVPSGLIWGQADRFLPTGSLAFFRDHLPNPSVLLLKGCGHLPQQERPLAVIRFIRRFVAALPPC